MNVLTATGGKRRVHARWSADPTTVARRREESARRRFRASPAKRLVMWKELSSLLDRFDLTAALEIIHRGHSEDGTRPNDLIASVAEYWIPRLRAPQPFADIVRNAVSEHERLMIAVGQDKTNQAQILARMHHAEKLMYDVKARWRATFREPVGLIVMAWGMLVGYAYMVLWQYGQYPTRPRGYALMANNYADWLFHWGSWMVPAAVVAIALVVARLLKYWLSPSRTAAERYWPFSLYKASAAANFLHALTILQTAGEDLPASLRAMAKTAGPYLRWQIAAIEPIVRSKSIGDAVRATKRWFPDAHVNAQLDVYSRDDPRNFATHLERIADDFTADLIERMESARKATTLMAISVAALLQVVITAFMLAMSLPT